MTIKDASRFGSWRFFMINPENGQEFKIPMGNSDAVSLPALVQIVVAQMDQFDRITEGKYTLLAREKAASQNISFPAYIDKLIQHQICLRNGGSDLCWANGVGDQIHDLFKKVDGLIAKLPTPLQSVAKSIVQLVTPSHTRTLGGCSSCGGTVAYNPDVNNGGRVDTLNELGK